MTEEFGYVPFDSQDERDEAMYGCLRTDLQGAICMEEEMLPEYINPHYTVAMSLLSDAQHLIEYQPDTARQYINRAKYIMGRWNKREEAK